MRSGLFTPIAISLLFTTFISVAKAQDSSHAVWEEHRDCYEMSSNRNYTEALSCYETVLHKFQQLNDVGGEALTLLNMGTIYGNLGGHITAVEYLEQAVQLSHSAGETDWEVLALNNLGSNYASLDRHDDAITRLNHAADLATQVDDLDALTNVLNTLGFAYERANRNEEAISVLNRSLEIARQNQDRKAEMKALWNLGSAYSNLGQDTEAIRILEDSLAIAEELNDIDSQGFVLQRLGSVYADLGNYPTALEVHQRNLELARTSDNPGSISIALLNVAGTYFYLGNYERAQQTLEESLPLMRSTNNKSGESSVLMSLGLIAAEQDEIELAYQMYSQSYDIAESINNRSLMSLILSNRSLLQTPEEALVGLRQSLDHARAINDPSKEGWALMQLGYHYYQQDNYTQAVQYYEQAANRFKNIGEKRSEAAAYGGMGFTYRDMNRLADAEQVLYESIAIQDTLRGGLTDQDKISIFDTQGNAYETLQDVLIRQDKEAAALEVAERSRARAFVDLLSQRLSPEQIEGRVATPLSAAQMQNVARLHKATLVEYSLIYDEQLLLIWVVTADDIKFEKIYLNNTSSSISELITSSRQALGSRSRGGLVPATSYNPILEADNLDKLYDLLIDPIKRHLPSDETEQIIFIPQGQLSLVPFPALKASDGSYLIQHHTVLTAPAIQVLDLTYQKRLSHGNRGEMNGNEVLVIGNPDTSEIEFAENESLRNLAKLPGAETEAIEIASSFGTQAYIGPDATEARVKQAIARMRLIHLATHGLLEFGQATDSQEIPGAIALTPGEDEDGLLTASELLEMELVADLVVLSACDTGQGAIRGDGVIGLSRSLISAGVPSVIVSLWSVPDAPTAELMTEFYRQMRSKGHNKAQALRQAMLETLKTYPDPKDWAAFTLIGESE
ncbi:MAG: CHAT domain-containing tetratricopeptide repeat protein [Cyanobacteria bacterium P01_D01_bin.156]